MQLRNFGVAGATLQMLLRYAKANRGKLEEEYRVCTANGLANSDSAPEELPPPTAGLRDVIGMLGEALQCAEEIGDPTDVAADRSSLGLACGCVGDHTNGAAWLEAVSPAPAPSSLCFPLCFHGGVCRCRSFSKKPVWSQALQPDGTADSLADPLATVYRASRLCSLALVKWRGGDAAAAVASRDEAFRLYHETGVLNASA